MPQHTVRGEIVVRVFLKKIRIVPECETDKQYLDDNLPVEKDGIRFEVRDTGKGLAGIDTELLFEPFSQGTRGTRVAVADYQDAEKVMHCMCTVNRSSRKAKNPRESSRDS
jgi:hypothetical protein